MNLEEQALWEKIDAYQLDAEGVRFPFSAKLAKENGWTAAFAQRAIREYKRFLMLGMKAGHPVSPSEAVDQVWHMHMVYTEDYWKRLCGDILGRPFHHHPSKGGEDESAKFEDWYARTLESYARLFGEAPPTDIWPDPATRKEAGEDFVRVDRSRTWVIRKPRIRLGRWALAGLGLATVGCMGANPFNFTGPEFLGFYFVFGFVLIGIALALKASMRNPRTGPPLTDLDPYELAYLNEGKVHAVNTAIAALTDRQMVEVTGKEPRIKSLSYSTQGLHHLEQEVINRTTRDPGVRLGDLRRVLEQSLEPTQERLVRRGLLVDPSTTMQQALPAFGVAMIVPIVGMIKIGVGIERVKPVEILVVLVIIAFVAALAILLKPVHRSRYGDEVLADYRRKTRRPAKGITGPDPDFAFGVAAFGMSCLAGTQYAALQTSLKPPVNNSSGCGGGCSGAGGSCGGGGCGGCGGGD